MQSPGRTPFLDAFCEILVGTIDVQNPAPPIGNMMPEAPPANQFPWDSGLRPALWHQWGLPSDVIAAGKRHYTEIETRGPLSSAVHLDHLLIITADGKEHRMSSDAVELSQTLVSLSRIREPDLALGVVHLIAPSQAEAAAQVFPVVASFCEGMSKLLARGAPEADREAFSHQEIDHCDDDTLFSIILMANYLDIASLLDVACKRVADYIKECKSPQEIRRRFNIKNDFTPEEEEEVRAENAWANEEGGPGEGGGAGEGDANHE